MVFTRQNVPMSLRSDEAGEVLRARGLRSTPQRRAILGAFQGDHTEHLSADELYARAAESLPDLSRGTVYATLAEFSDLGLLSASGAPEPVRYETNTTHHSHFRCRLCVRIFDLLSGLQNPEEITDARFTVERVDTRAEGICAACNDYDAGLRAGARTISRSGPAADAPCHRVTRGVEVPTTFVGGSERRHWLESHENTANEALPH
jgi:Fur family transcriptional regulator, stress-responsive regulator